ncbi:MurR/RpiR family transcriptional regulator [Desulfosarcina ovata]|uniref:RpiR family transcriptional regulator n=1 Tax=Desulfosarcina ovata subsp. ovata TaxID=2752305 RepID=A0A5K8AFU2_9BACT|nr:MurR/RpiR family transcriptional regulator [Desulfosarcina ovata]BBO91563.1 RpiR family transcriptional regulator [Desulfosarcina ovata subsp. ovata]
MQDAHAHPVIKGIVKQLESLTPKGKLLGNYIIQNPRKAVFMTTKELAEACGVSEATVVRFVGQLGYSGYGEFLQALRDFVDSGLSLPDRVDLPGMKGPGTDLLHRVVFEEMTNLRQFYETIDMKRLADIVDRIEKSPAVYVIGSRISYTFAYYLGWSLTKVRKGVNILKGSDSTTIDWLTGAPEESLVIIITTSRYPNELIRMGKVARRLGHTLLVVTDSRLCPVIPFAHQSLVVPSRSIALIGYPTTISCIINYLVLELVNRQPPHLKAHQEKLEQMYLENDILFNMHGD